MSGWLRHLTLSAQARTGLGPGVVIWAVVAVLAAAVALVFLLIAAFIWLADRYDALTAGLVLGGVFLGVALIALVACLMVRRRNIARARRELEARARAGANWLDPKLIAVGLQVGQAIGWRKLISLAAVALVAAGVAREWYGKSEADPDDEAPRP
jgi:hypothetical protein